MSANSFYNGLKVTPGEINKNFRIKVSGWANGMKLHTLIGVSGLIDLIDDIELVNRLIERAFDSSNDKTECKLRRGVKVVFYVK